MSVQIKDRGMGLPIQWLAGAFTQSELEKLQKNRIYLSVGDVIRWRNDKVRLISFDPLVVEEIQPVITL